MDNDIRGNNLNKKLDVIIIPNDKEVMITGGNIDDLYIQRGRTIPNFPPEYRSGLGEDGVEALINFVNEGGTLVCFNDSSNFAIHKFKLNVRNVVEGLSDKEFFCPGSTLWTNWDNSHYLGYGMPKRSLILSLDSPTFKIVPSFNNDIYEVVASYPENNILKNGWLIGEERIKKKVAMLMAHQGKGKIILIGFRSQYRAATHNTYKPFFNSLLH